jgi:hypothetical protein
MPSMKAGLLVFTCVETGCENWILKNQKKKKKKLRIRVRSKTLYLGSGLRV